MNGVVEANVEEENEEADEEGSSSVATRGNAHWCQNNTLQIVAMWCVDFRVPKQLIVCPTLHGAHMHAIPCHTHAFDLRGAKGLMLHACACFSEDATIFFFWS